MFSCGFLALSFMLRGVVGSIKFSVWVVLFGFLCLSFSSSFVLFSVVYLLSGALLCFVSGVLSALECLSRVCYVSSSVITRGGPFTLFLNVLFGVGSVSSVGPLLDVLSTSSVVGCLVSSGFVMFLPV